MKTFSLLIVVAVAYSGITPAQAECSPLDPRNSPHVQELGAWAVSEHVKQAHDGLKFSRVISGELQTDAGVRYHLVIEAINGDGKRGRYDAFFVEEVRSSTRTLVSFTPAK